MKKNIKEKIEQQIDDWIGYWDEKKSSPIGVRWRNIGGGKWVLQIFVGDDDGQGDWLVIKDIPYRLVLDMYENGTLKEYVETEKAIAIINGYECNL